MQPHFADHCLLWYFDGMSLTDNPEDDAWLSTAPLPTIAGLPDYGYRLSMAKSFDETCRPFSRPRLRQMVGFVGMAYRLVYLIPYLHPHLHLYPYHHLHPHLLLYLHPRFYSYLHPFLHPIFILSFIRSSSFYSFTDSVPSSFPTSFAVSLPSTIISHPTLHLSIHPSQLPAYRLRIRLANTHPPPSPLYATVDVTAPPIKRLIL